MLESKFLKDNVENIQKLMEIPIMRDFEVDHLGDLLRQSKIRVYDNGEQIIKEGDKDRWLYFLLSGKVRIVKKGEELAFHKRTGDMFGEMSFISASARSASAYSVGETTCFATDASTIETLETKDKFVFYYILYRAFANVLAERLGLAREELVKTKKELKRSNKELSKLRTKKSKL